MASYETCKSCGLLIDLYPPPARSNGQIWNGPLVVDTTVFIDGQRFCEKCGAEKLAGKKTTPGYRIDHGPKLTASYDGGGSLMASPVSFQTKAEE